MFWGLRLEPGKRYSTTVDRSFHISMAALDCSSVKSENEVISVMLDEKETNVSFILCNLQKSKLMQSALDLNFMSGDSITIYCKGNGIVHLSGYIVLEDDEELLEQLGEEEDDEEAEEETEVSDTEVPSPKGKMNGLERKRRKEELKKQAAKKKKLDSTGDESADSDDDEEEDDEDEEDDIMGLEGESDDEEEDEEEEDSEESDEENEIPSKPQQQMKKNKKNNLQNQQQAGAANKQQNKGKQPQKTENGLSQGAQGKKNKKKGEKVPGAEGQNANAKKPDESPLHAKKTLNGGVMIKEIKVGNGPVCKSGKTACVYYVGRFKQNNKIFDSATDGAGFKFRVGKGEVIKGWDVGLNGMKVGGKRLITCPPHMAYGQKGSPPSIPPNSTLVFEVELKSIN